MKPIRILLSALLVIACSFLHAQRRHHTRYKLGVKFSAERAGWRNYNPKLYPVYNGGLQFVGNIAKSNWSCETGLYLTTKIPDYKADFRKYKFLNLPFNARWDNAGFYFSAGFFVDYLVFIYNGLAPKDPLDQHRSPGFGLNGAVGYKKK